MAKENKIKNHVVSCILTVILITFMTLFAEINENFKNLLKIYFYHHWIGKSIIAIIFFILLIFILNMNLKKKVSYYINLLNLVFIFCSLIIFLFFVWHFFQ